MSYVKAVGGRFFLVGALALCTVGALHLFGASSAGAATPTVTIGVASNPGYTTVEVSGAVNPQGEPVEFFYEVSTDGVLWERKNLGSYSEATEPQELNGTIEGLKAETTYQVRLTAFNYNDGSYTYSAEANPEFTTVGPVPAPTVTIDPVTTFTATSAHFSGKIDPGAANSDPAFNVRWHFECEPACLSLSNGAGEFGDDGNSQAVETDAEIEPNTAYAVKLVAENAGGSDSAQTLFQSGVALPVVETVPAFAFGPGTEALIGGKVNPRNSTTVYWLEYGPGPGGSGPGVTYPSSIPATLDGEAGTGGQPIFRVQEISGLTPASTYHFRVVAENAAGKSEGDDVSFETLPAPALPPAGCPNDQVRGETGSEALAECRAYEMVTPPDKNGGDAGEVSAVTADGDRLGFSSAGGFSGTESVVGLVPYLAQRYATGWLSRPMQVPIGVPNLGLNGTTSPVDFTEDLSVAVNSGRALAPEEPAVRNIFLKRDDGSSVWVTKPTFTGYTPSLKAYTGRSADGSHIVFESSQDFGAATDGTSQVWEWVNGEVRLVSVLPGGEMPVEGATVGNGTNASETGGTTFNGTLSQPTAVSEDGDRIFFGRRPGSLFGVYVREDGVRTRQLDLSQRTGSVGEPGDGQFLGAATDGSVAVIKSEAELTDDDAPEGGLYAYDLESDELRLLASVALSDIQGVSLISDDGSRVYFVAGRQLLPGQGVSGGHNLYLADPDGLHFIATLGDDDAQDWFPFAHGANRLTVAATPSGRDFIFQSYERLTSFDNSGHQEIYRFDAQTMSLTCVSCGSESIAASGDASMFPNPAPRGGFLGSPYQGGRSYPISDDGSRVLFQTTQALVPGDVNSLDDVYQYRAGDIDLISTGTSKYDSDVAGITPDGRNIFFSTRDSLVGQDIDGGNADIYDARVDGGFTGPAQGSGCESAETCNGPPPPAPGFAPPESTAHGAGNPPARGKSRKTCRGKKRGRGKCGKKRHGHRHSKSGRNG